MRGYGKTTYTMSGTHFTTPDTGSSPSWAEAAGQVSSPSLTTGLVAGGSMLMPAHPKGQWSMEMEFSGDFEERGRVTRALVEEASIPDIHYH